MDELTCVECGRLFDDKVAVYRHIIDAHRKRYCLFCEHEEGFRPQMRLHVAAKHRTVDVDAMGGRLWRSANETVQTVDGGDSYAVECVAVEGFIPPKGLSFESEIDCSSFERVVSAVMRPVSPLQEDGDDVILLGGSPQPQPATVDAVLPTPVAASVPPVESVPEMDAEKEFTSNVTDDGPLNAEDGGKRPRLASSDEDIQADLQQLVKDLFTAFGHSNRLTEDQLAHPLDVLTSVVKGLRSRIPTTPVLPMTVASDDIPEGVFRCLAQSEVAPVMLEVGASPPLLRKVVVTGTPYQPVCSPVSDLEEDTGSLGSVDPVEVAVPVTSPSGHGEGNLEHDETAMSEQLEPRRSLVPSVLQPNEPSGLDLRLNLPSASPPPALPRLRTLGAVCPCNCHCTCGSCCPCHCSCPIKSSRFWCPLSLNWIFCPAFELVSIIDTNHVHDCDYFTVIN